MIFYEGSEGGREGGREREREREREYCAFVQTAMYERIINLHDCKSFDVEVQKNALAIIT